MKKLIVICLVLVLSFSLFGLIIFDDDFDSATSNLVAWKRSSTSNVLLHTGNYKIGRAAMEIKYNANATTYLNVEPFKNLVLTFKMAKNSLESGEMVVCEYSTNKGSSWVTAASLLHTASSGTYYSYTVSIPNTSILWIRFRIRGSGIDDYGYIEDVLLTGDRK